MRRLHAIAALLVCASLASQATAQSQAVQHLLRYKKPVAAPPPPPSGPVAVTHRTTVWFANGFGPGPATVDNVAISNGDKVVVLIHSSGNGNGAISALTANSGAITFTQICAEGSGSDRGHAFYADTSGVTEVDLSATLASGGRAVAFAVFTLTGAASGGAVASNCSSFGVANDDPIDVDGGLTTPTDGAMLLSVAAEATGTIVWTGATEGAEANDGSGVFASASQTSAANVTIRGQGGGGPDYEGVHIVSATFQP